MFHQVIHLSTTQCLKMDRFALEIVPLIPNMMHTTTQAGCISIPIPWPIPVNGHSPSILCIHLPNSVKSDGTQKACACIGGSKCIASWKCLSIQTYAFHTYILLCIVDTTNTFQQSLPPTEQCLLQINEAHWP